ncbi:hypothetical protein HMPREF7215_1406 [Pyramidobacter piscolens W5455]|uniref:Uncharacterized protein n=1 Tax=Pyramidobacter piscolens W5455 TaxID=352165 RepID=A0ABM9ZYC4_9BACT|nr:hypothetical protein HMPREF7215_1406 [Pyramidobacter piscolens W5455]
MEWILPCNIVLSPFCPNGGDGNGAENLRRLSAPCFFRPCGFRLRDQYSVFSGTIP